MISTNVLFSPHRCRKEPAAVSSFNRNPEETAAKRLQLSKLLLPAVSGGERVPARVHATRAPPSAAGENCTLARSAS